MNFFYYLTGWIIFFNLRFIKEEKPSNHYTISVIIPARNEEHNIGKLLKSLISQSYPIHEIIVVDDNSSDNTSQVVKSFQNVKLISLRKEPDNGWLGKPWACWNGYLHSSGEILIFIDADVELDSKAIESIVGTLEKNEGLISIWPYQRLEKPYEHLNFVFNMATVGSMALIKFLKNKPIGAYGPLIATFRKDYEKVGGHFSVKDKVIEDVELGKLYMKHKLKVHNYLGNGIVKFRMYPKGLTQLYEGITKNMGSGAISAGFRNFLVLFLWFTGIYSSIFSLMVDKQVFMYILYIIQLSIFNKKLGDYHILDNILYPFHFLFFLFIFFVSCIKTFFLRKVKWKGREIKV